VQDPTVPEVQGRGSLFLSSCSLSISNAFPMLFPVNKKLYHAAMLGMLTLSALFLARAFVQGGLLPSHPSMLVVPQLERGQDPLLLTTPPRAVRASTSLDAGPYLSEADALLGIVRTSETTWSVDRRVLDWALEHEPTGKRVRVSPVSEQGRAIGIQVFGVQSTPMFAALGLQNKDILRTFNGTEFVDNKAMTSLRGEHGEFLDTHVLELRRAGKEQRFVYTLH
jgi:hypothetical protein